MIIVSDKQFETIVEYFKSVDLIDITLYNGKPKYIVRYNSDNTYTFTFLNAKDETFFRLAYSDYFN